MDDDPNGENGFSSVGEEPEGISGLKDKPADVSWAPETERAEFAASARAFLSNRSRAVAAAIIAISWGWLASRAKLAIPLQRCWKTALIIAASMSLGALLLDNGQYLFEYIDATSLNGQLWGEGARFTFKSKQVLTSVSAIIVIATAFVISFNAR